METIRASCLCGKSSYGLTLLRDHLPLSTNICHCNICRHVSGVLCATYASVPEDVALPDMSNMKAYKTSDRLTRYFCSSCGTHMLVRTAGEKAWNLASGTLEKADGVIKLADHIYIEDTADGGSSDWLPSIAGETLPRYKAATGSEQPAPGWHKPSTRTTSAGSERLHAHCQCKGVNMYISHASTASAETQGPYPDVLLPFYVEERPPPTDPWWLRDKMQKYLGGVCTCDSCRLATGFEFQQWAFIPTADISLSADGTILFSRQIGTLKSYRSSKDVTRRFCGTCGATVFWDGDIRPGLIDVSAGLLAADEGARAQKWIEWATDRLSYREDSVKRASAITVALEAGLQTFEQSKL